MSLNLNPAYFGSHWESVEAGAAKTGRKPDWAQWRMVREVFVADTDAEAIRLSVGLHMGRMMGEYFLQLFKSSNSSSFSSTIRAYLTATSRRSSARVTTGSRRGGIP